MHAKLFPINTGRADLKEKAKKEKNEKNQK